MAKPTRPTSASVPRSPVPLVRQRSEKVIFTGALPPLGRGGGNARVRRDGGNVCAGLRRGRRIAVASNRREVSLSRQAGAPTTAHGSALGRRRRLRTGGHRKAPAGVPAGVRAEEVQGARRPEDPAK